jgi:hypothetical protein
MSKESHGSAPEPITPASLTAFLAANTVVPLILGKLEKRTPAVGRSLTDQQRQELGLRPGGATLVYDLVEGEVILDMAANTAIISFAKGDVASAISTFDRLLKRDAPQFNQLEDSEHPHGGRRRLRVYEARFDGAIRCRIEANYPAQGASGVDNRFVVRVIALSEQQVN